MELGIAPARMSTDPVPRRIVATRLQPSIDQRVNADAQRKVPSLRRSAGSSRSLFQMVRRHLTHYQLMGTGAPQEIFSKTYGTYQWASSESRSEKGFQPAATENLRAYLPKLFERLSVRTFLDGPRGDWNWVREVDGLGGRWKQQGDDGHPLGTLRL